MSCVYKYNLLVCLGAYTHIPGTENGSYILCLFVMYSSYAYHNIILQVATSIICNTKVFVTD